jgi:hypothetical protein
MGQREFQIEIGADGTVEVRARGFKGKTCLEVVKLFEQIVGELKAQEQTNEFYEPEEQVRLQIDQRH